MAGSGVGHLYHELEFPIKCDRLSRLGAAFANNGIISIMLSSAELDTLDLSHLQLFCSEKIEAPSSELCHLVERSKSVARNDQSQSSSPSSSASSSPPSTFSFPTVPEISRDRRQELVEDQERAGDICAFDSPDSFAFFPDTKDRKTKKTLPSNMIPSDCFLPIFKSKAVLEAEKALADNLSKMIGLSATQAAAKKKALSMDELTFQAHVVSISHTTCSADEHKPTQISQDDSTLHHRSNKVKPKAPLPMLDVKQRPILVQNGNLLDVSQDSITGDTMKNVVRSLARQMTREMEMEGSKASIDLKASPAAKFLLQLMPWEISPWTPFTPVRTPAAVPFKWEVAPGKPRLVELVATKPDQSLHLPPRLFISQASDQISIHRSDDQPRYNSQMKQERQDFVFGGLISPKRHAQFDTLTAGQQQSSFIPQSECSTRAENKNSSMVARDLSSTKAEEMASENVLKTSAACADGSDAGSGRAFVSIRQHLSSEYALPSPWKGPLTPGMSSPCRNLGPLQENQQQHKGVRSSVRVWLERCNCKRIKGKVQEGGNLWAPTLAAYYKTLNYQPPSTGIAQRPQLEDEKKKRQKPSWTDNNHDQQVFKKSVCGAACANTVSKPRVAQLNLPSVKQWRCQQRTRKWTKRPRRWIMRRIRTSYRVFVAVYKAIIRKASFWRKQRHWQLRSSIDSNMPYQSLHD
ncbi:hypothetical protein O6H91_23G053600 [Diphasiastrum complanatum]|uniref:Uncharacterized protein n=3 Tax=Diphasiastrum complanatum TaxID=34168 RepID=A0ACC2AAN1_DIPCM|nr:hypothetical protein O6H91_Y165000 [Diphasiastrum complanatum]KAJ7295772.1 hypothetical protein O6H91_Y165000 [Diphasiastrum complanatum]KAJ7514638.1 hypothetical protein O6H91_23G053600 [Diphasiastrum complanatum]KAJ7514639.1 hypothetical protein O6H91_23G053600 [Diphasiastrum complanatum]KAJ7514640.1 hypothetical protein O6H91_23G053600 [Diphasiastrum complanatum]